MNNKSPHFQYRIVKVLVDGKYPSYKIAEVFFDNGSPINFTIVDKISSFPNPNLGTTDQEAIQNLKNDVVEMLAAFDLDYIDVQNLTEL